MAVKTRQKLQQKPLGSYLLRLEPSASGEHVLLTDLLSGERLEFDSLEAAKKHLEQTKPKSGLR
jgi:hypothetical protein